jgi:hypothetical protein
LVLFYFFFISRKKRGTPILGCVVVLLRDFHAGNFPPPSFWAFDIGRDPSRRRSKFGKEKVTTTIWWWSSRDVIIISNLTCVGALFVLLSTGWLRFCLLVCLIISNQISRPLKKFAIFPPI